jgi:membrane-associated phospholipid phosphatase
MRYRLIDGGNLLRWLLSSFPYLVLLVLALGYAKTKHKYLLNLLTVLIISSTLNYFILKPSIYRAFSTYEWAVKRPLGCSRYCTGVYGMPSDHAQGTALLCLTVTYLFLSQVHLHPNPSTPALLGSLHLVGLAVIYSRVHYQYHTGFQVIIGIFVGWIIGLCFILMSVKST